MKRIRSLTYKELAVFCRELGVLLHAGIPLLSSLQIMETNQKHKSNEENICRELIRMIRQGVLLSESMESMNLVFPAFVIQMFRVAEAHGNLAGTAFAISEYFQKEHHIREKLRSAVWYPKFLLILTGGTTVVLMEGILPRLEFLFSGMQELPMPTRILYGITNGIRVYDLRFLIGAAIVFCLIKLVDKNRIVCRVKGWMQVHIPVLGRFYRFLYTARFARILSSLYCAGVPVASALPLVKETMDNGYIKEQLEQVLKCVRRGERLSDALRHIDGLEPMLAGTVRIGEEADSLASMLKTTAEDLNREAEAAADQMILYLEPCLILIMSVIVGFIMVAVMMPVYESYASLEFMMY